MDTSFRSRLKRSFLLYGAYLFVRDRFWVWKWRRRGSPVPPPPLVKQRCVVAHGRRRGLKVLVETGTYRGDMVRATRSAFREIYSIELSDTLHARARGLFAAFPHIHLMQGDSATALPEVLKRVHEPCLFWLDAHYSGGETAKALYETPVLVELAHIFAHPVKEHVILVDDARCFTGQNDYPSLAQVEACVKQHRSGWICEVRDDIICIHPA
jgi:hypothetical protein